MGTWVTISYLISSHSTLRSLRPTTSTVAPATTKYTAQAISRTARLEIRTTLTAARKTSAMSAMSIQRTQ